MTDPKPTQRPEPPSLLKLGANVRALRELIDEATDKRVLLDVARARRHAIRILELLG
jgi:hypothetical protein